MDYSLSGLDLKKALDGNTKIVLYPDLYKYKNIDELLYPNDHIFLLYEYKPKYGHWVLLFKQGNKIEHFDSYGYKPDEEFEFIPKKFRERNKMAYAKLNELLLGSGKEIEYNNFELQRESKRISTCGRWGLSRLMFKDMNIDEFKKLMDYLKEKTGLNYDEIVYYITEPIIGK